MLAHHATRAGCSRASFVGGVSPPPAIAIKLTKQAPSVEKSASLNDGSSPPGRPGWKYAYEDVLWSKQKLPLKLRGLLQVLLRLSDHLGRVWWSQAAIAEHAGCTVRTLRRLLPALEASGHARVEPMTFRQLALAQATLGLPLPGRNDDGQAPDLITLLLEGKPATELRPPTRRRAPPGQNVQGSPRTKTPHGPVMSPFDPADKTSADPRDLSADLYRNGRDPSQTAHPFKVPFESSAGDHVPEKVPTTFGTTELPGKGANHFSEEQAWLVLEAAYDRHYRRVYHARPTNKPLPIESRMLMAGHLADMATLLRARFVERNIDITTLENPPLELLADEALRVWFDSSGTNDYLRRVSHRMSALSADLPYRVRKAIEALLERLAPKPEPRRAALPVLPFVRDVVRSKPAPSELAQGPVGPVIWAARPKPPIAKTNLAPDVVQVVTGLSEREALLDLAQTPTLASELVTIARERGASMKDVMGALDIAANVCQKQKPASTAAKAGIVYKLVLEAFDAATPRRSTA
jgi:hypothetical protein